MAAIDLRGRLRRDYISGKGIFGKFIYPYREEINKSKFFLETMETFVEASERDEVAALEKGIEALTPEQRQEYWEWHYPLHWQEIFSNRLRASFVMQLCSLVEGELNEICERVSVISQAPLVMGDLRGSTLSRPKKYLQAFARFQNPSQESWFLLERIFDVRNVMVHASGFSGDYRNHKQIAAFTAVAPGISLTHDHIEVKREFCEYCLARVSEFCDQLHGAYESFRATAQTIHRLESRGEV